MPDVNVSYKMYLPGGHHRQPRNVDVDLNLAPPAGGNVPFTPPFFAQLPYTLGGETGMSQMLFWNVTDGVNGQVLPPVAFASPLNSSPLNVTAWYWPISGPGVGGGGPGIIDDEFSAASGTFLNDTFVDVTSDPSLTSEANVVGDVPTVVAETLSAHLSVASTTEPFSQWILNSSIMPVGNNVLTVPKGTDGIAIAVYQSGSRPPVKINVNQYAIWQWVDYGTMVDGGPHPWNPYVNELMTGVALAAAARGVNGKLRSELVSLAAKQVGLAAEGIQKAIQAGQKQG